MTNEKRGQEEAGRKMDRRGERRKIERIEEALVPSELPV
jgi:hypothetical protein